MKPFNVVYDNFVKTINSYIEANKDFFCKNHRLFGTAGVPRAKELLKELESLKNDKFSTTYHLIATVGQDKYMTGQVLISKLMFCVLNANEVTSSIFNKKAEEIAHKINSMPLPYTRHIHTIKRDYTSKDPLVRSTTTNWLFNYYTLAAKEKIELQKERLQLSRSRESGNLSNTRKIS